MSKQGRIGSGICYGKRETKKESSDFGVKRLRQKFMTKPEKYMFPLAALALVIAVCVVPLAAEISNVTCKYPGLLTRTSRIMLG